MRKEEDKKEKSGFSYLFFDSSFDDLTMETGREVNNQTVGTRRKTIYVPVRSNA